MATALTALDVQNIVLYVLDSAHLSKPGVNQMVEGVMNETDIPPSANITHQLDHKVATLRAGVVEDLLADPMVRTRIRESVEEAMTSAYLLALLQKEDQYCDARILIKDPHIGTAMSNLVDEGLARVHTRDHTLAQVRTYLLRDKRIVRGITNMAMTKVEESADRLELRPPEREGPAGELFVDYPFRPALPSRDGYSESDSEPTTPVERKKNRANKEK